MKRVHVISLPRLTSNLLLVDGFPGTIRSTNEFQHNFLPVFASRDQRSHLQSLSKRFSNCLSKFHTSNVRNFYQFVIHTLHVETQQQDRNHTQARRKRDIPTRTQTLAASKWMICFYLVLEILNFLSPLAVGLEKTTSIEFPGRRTPGVRYQIRDLSWDLNVRASFEQVCGIAVGDLSIGHRSANNDVRVGRAECLPVG
jgi:hypothetical protein